MVVETTEHLPPATTEKYLINSYGTNIIEYFTLSYEKGLIDNLIAESVPLLMFLPFPGSSVIIIMSYLLG